MASITTSDGTEIAYDDHPSRAAGGEATPAILVHGITESAATWDPLIDRLTSSRRVIAMDLRGHGRSGTADRYDLDAMAGDVIALAVARGVERPHLVGHSLGGAVVSAAGAVLPVSSVANVDQSLQLDAFKAQLTAFEAQLRDPEAFPFVIQGLFEMMAGEKISSEEMERVNTARRPDQDVVLGVWEMILSMPTEEIAAVVEGALAGYSHVDVPLPLAVRHRPRRRLRRVDLVVHRRRRHRGLARPRPLSAPRRARPVRGAPRILLVLNTNAPDEIRHASHHPPTLATVAPMYAWNDEQLMIRDAVREFVEAEIAPRREELEFGDTPPYDLLRKLFTTFGMDQMAKDRFEKTIAFEKSVAAATAAGETLPERDAKGAGNDPSTSMIPIIELCRHSPGMVTAMGVSMGLTSAAIMSKGTIAQKERWALDLLTLDKIGAWAITEPNSGSDAFGSMKATARRDGDEYVLNGSKTFITNGPYAETIVFICKTRRGQSARGSQGAVVRARHRHARPGAVQAVAQDGHAPRRQPANCSSTTSASGSTD